ncbi:MAG: fucose isomerase [Defluviitaleaceae bacterium]|nr:fucose isomerase [Defluviitaleaceae bacterium]
MYDDYKLTIGFAPTRRLMYDPEHALKNKREIRKRIGGLALPGVEIADIDWLNEEGLLIDTGDVSKVAGHFISKGVNALFMPHCNYGTEEVVAMLGKKMGVPFLLYGPRDAAPPGDGARIRQTDTQCGLFPSSKALQRYGVPFTYIENSAVESKIFAEGFDLFQRAATVANKTKGMRVGSLGSRPKPFLCVMYNEAELLEKFGIEIVPIGINDVVAAVAEKLGKHAGDVGDVVEELRGQADIGGANPEIVKKHAALRLVIFDFAKKHNLDAIGGECWTAFPGTMGIVPCAAFGDICNRGLPIGCETDVLGAVSMAMLQAASRGEGRPFCADLTVRHPDDDNAELLWHCGPFPVGAARTDARATRTDNHGQWELARGKMTIARLDELNGNYSLLAGEGEAVEGPPTNGTYCWFKVGDWPEWEKKIMYGPYIHHVAGMHGHWGNVLGEAKRYLGYEIDLMR